MIIALAAAQLIALIVLVTRLLPGRHRLPPVAPSLGGEAGALTIVVPTLNENHRIAPCLEGLIAQGSVVREILVVDSGSTDGTIDTVNLAAQRDARITLLRDDALPPGWIGKVWALQHALAHANAEYILGIDADTIPQPGMAGGVLAAARQHGYDAVSFAPRFMIESAGERWLQPALLVTLVYRFGAAGTDTGASRMMANGQCFLAKRRVLTEAGGYSRARTSFSDDVTLARYLAGNGYNVGFLDGSRLYAVRAYTSAREVWREWGRSLDLSDSAQSRAQQWSDVIFLMIVQGTALPAFLIALGSASPYLLASSSALLAIRLMMQLALRGSYAVRGAPYWLSPLADPLAAIRILVSTVVRPKRWRGREYALTQ